MKDIDWSCPADLEPYAKAHELEMKEIDAQMHSAGFYNKIAFDVVMSHFGAGLAGKKSRAKYPEKPLMQDVDQTDNGNSESNEEVAVFEMNQRINALRMAGLEESPI